MQIKRISVIKPARADSSAVDFSMIQDVLRIVLRKISTGYNEEKLRNCMDILACPSLLEDYLQSLNNSNFWVHVAGTVDQRVIFLGTAIAQRGWIFSLNRPLEEIDETLLAIVGALDYQCTHSAVFVQSAQLIKRLRQPRVLLIGLYHPETFPLPRFHLGISDLARALRSAWLGRTDLIDMQLGHDIKSIANSIAAIKPDIIGISATFGQYDLLSALLDDIRRERPDCLTVVGGSLAAHLREPLLTSKQVDIVAVGAGENTITDVVSYWLQEKEISDIADIAYRAEDKVLQTKRTNNRQAGEVIPELDLLDSTLEAYGVMQLESSRGCSYACSFCPRSHKGIWAGEHSSAFSSILPFVSKIFQKHPYVDKRIFLVDEEFVGYQTDEIALGRCMKIAESLKNYGFRFETSSRVDQVSRPRKDKAWHIERMAFWANLKRTGLSRCLFGVESGVDSILKRFNKKTTARQNIVALRILSLLQIPIRCTYITFDPLMSYEELNFSIEFLERTDILIARPETVGADDFSALFEIAINDELAAECAVAKPFYTSVSYLGVSMEALLGSPYLTLVEQAGLARDVNMLMGRRDSVYLDQRIGLASNLSQRWVDRNFSLDYTLKSLQKTSAAEALPFIEQARQQLKICAHEFIKRAIGASPECREKNEQYDHNLLLDEYFNEVNSIIFSTIHAACENLQATESNLLRSQLNLWLSKSDWELINGQCD